MSHEGCAFETGYDPAQEKGLRMIDVLIVLGLLVFIGILSIPGVKWLIDCIFQKQQEGKEQ
jgi:hypothetical protein